MKPFSGNIVFVDTEFSSLDPYKGEILSIGIVKLNGEELYLELEYDGEYDEWVKENIVPTLKETEVSREEVKKRVKDFIGKEKPYMVSYVNQYDAIYLRKLFGAGNDPFFWIPIDFASMLFAFGMTPESCCSEDRDKFYKEIGIDSAKYKQHNALDDARLLRKTYLKFIEMN